MYILTYINMYISTYVCKMLNKLLFYYQIKKFNYIKTYFICYVEENSLFQFRIV